jgi:hypothetical protein
MGVVMVVMMMVMVMIVIIRMMIMIMMAMMMERGVPECCRLCSACSLVPALWCPAGPQGSMVASRLQTR